VPLKPVDRLPHSLSLRTQLVLVTSVLIALAIAVTSLVAISALRAQMVHQLDEEMKASSSSLVSSVGTSQTRQDGAGGPGPGGPDLVHVDAYRLSSAEELDDLDLEFSLEKSVTVIEWGRSKAEHLSDSRLELDFTRLTGADASIAYAAENYSPTGEGEFNWDALDDREEESADASEPRLLRITAYGPRWEGEAYRSLEAAMLKLGVE